MNTEAIARLQQRGIKPSAQRIAIMDYLLTHRTHPTVDTIYHDLSPEMPTLSRTTVYNTLKLLSQDGAILELTIDKHTAHYDGDTHPHSHFQCRDCGRIIDLPLKNMVCEPHVGYNYVVTEVEIYYRGFCGKCMPKHQAELQRNGK